MNEIKVSVVFPIYNNQQYLERCIRSVMSQTMKDIEMILIDDGSTDGASQICDSLAEEDNRIKVIHKENAGSAAGRNQGISIARGMYIAFVESDDRIAPDMYEKLYRRATETNADVIKCGFYFCDESMREFKGFYSVAVDGEVFQAKDRPEIFLNHASIWAGLYKRSFIEQRGIRFIETPSATYSDFSWMAATFAYANRITILHEALYYYTFDNPNSSFKHSGEKSFYMIYHAKEATRILREAGIFEQVREEIGKNEFKACMGYAKKIRRDLRKDFFEAFHELLTDTFGLDFGYKRFNQLDKVFARLIMSGDYKRFYGMVDFLNKYIMPFYRSRFYQTVTYPLKRLKRR